MVREPTKDIRRCMKCLRLFVSPDVERVRRCHRCVRDEEAHQPRTVRLSDVHGAVKSHFKDS